MFSAMFPSQEQDPPAVLLVQNVFAAQHHANPVNTLRKSQDDDLPPLPPQIRVVSAPKHVPTFPVPRPHHFISNQALWKPDGPASECKHNPTPASWKRRFGYRPIEIQNAEVPRFRIVKGVAWVESLVMSCKLTYHDALFCTEKNQQVSHA